MATLCKKQNHYKSGNKRAVEQQRENGSCKISLKQNKIKTREEKKNLLGGGPEGSGWLKSRHHGLRPARGPDVNISLLLRVLCQNTGDNESKATD